MELEVFSHMTNLKEFELIGDIRDSFIDQLGKKEKLEIISLKKLKFQAKIKTFSILHFDRLEEIDFNIDWPLERFYSRGSELTLQTWIRFLESKSAKTLNTFVTDNLPNDAMVLKKLSNLNSLTNMECSFTEFEGGNLKYISEISNLKQLTLAFLKCGDGVPYLFNLTNLEKLILLQNGITHDKLVNIGKLNLLTDLDLSENEIGSEGANYLSNLPNLKCLVLQHNNISDEGLRNFNKLGQLTTLDLSFNHLTGVGVDYLSCSITDLSLSRNDIEDEPLKNFSKLQSLTQLDLSCNFISTGLIYLSECKLLKSLNIRKNLLTELSLLDFCQNGSNIEELDVSDNRKLSAKSFKDISNLKSLKELNISSIPTLGDMVFTHLAPLILTNLSMSDCGITDKGVVKFLKEYSSDSKTKLDLSLDYNDLTNIAIETFIKHSNIVNSIIISDSENFDSKLTDELKKKLSGKLYLTYISKEPKSRCSIQ